MNQDNYKNIEHTTKRKMDRMNAPTLDEALEGQQRLIAEKLQSTIESDNFHTTKRIAEEILEENDSVTVVAAALKMMTKEPDTTPIALTSEPPVVSRGSKKRGGNGNGYRDGNRSRDGRGGDGRNHDGATVMVAIVTVTVMVIVTVVVKVKVRGAQDLPNGRGERKHHSRKPQA